MIDTPLSINMYPYNKEDRHILELRTIITDYQIIKTIINIAYHDKAITLYPLMKDKPKALGRLIQLGILCKAEDGLYFKDEIKKKK